MFCEPELLSSPGADGVISSRVSSVTRFAARGRASALQVLAEQFREDIEQGLRVTFTPEGPELRRT